MQALSRLFYKNVSNIRMIINYKLNKLQNKQPLELKKFIIGMYSAKSERTTMMGVYLSVAAPNLRRCLGTVFDYRSIFCFV